MYLEIKPFVAWTLKYDIRYLHLGHFVMAFDVPKTQDIDENMYNCLLFVNWR